MPSFSLSARGAHPPPTSDGFPRNIQWQFNGNNLGDRHVQTINIVGDTGAVVRSGNTLTITLPAS